MKPIYRVCESLMEHLNLLSAFYVGEDLTPKRYNKLADTLIKLKDLLSRMIQ
jgi:hypothetical protein